MLQELSALYSLMNLAGGLVMCFFGYRWFRFVLFLIGFLLGFTIGFIGGAATPVGLLIGLLLGIVLGFLFRFLYFLGLFMLGALLGGLLGLLVAPPIAALLGVAGGILALFFHKLFVILSTGMVGGFMVVSSVLNLATDKNVLEALAGKFTGAQVLDLHQLLLTLGLSFALGVIGILVQSVTTSSMPSRLSKLSVSKARPGEFLRVPSDAFEQKGKASLRKGNPPGGTRSDHQLLLADGTFRTVVSIHPERSGLGQDSSTATTSTAPPEIPEEPLRSDSKYNPHLGLLDSINTMRRRERDGLLRDAFERDHFEWLEEIARLKSTNLDLRQPEPRGETDECLRVLSNQQRRDLYGEFVKLQASIDPTTDDYTSRFQLGLDTLAKRYGVSPNAVLALAEEGIGEDWIPASGTDGNQHP